MQQYLHGTGVSQNIGSTIRKVLSDIAHSKPFMAILWPCCIVSNVIHDAD